MPNCLVCDEKDAAKHYGSVCCSGCKGFFRRSVRFRRQYICAYDKKCSIQREYRNCCRACRFAKCMEIGLDPMMVHSDRSCDETPAAIPMTNPAVAAAAARGSSGQSPESNHSPTAGSSAATTAQIAAQIVLPIRKIEVESATADEDLRMEQAQNLAVATRHFMLTMDNLPLGAKGVIKPYNSRDFRSVKRYFTLVERLIDEFREHEYSHLIACSPLHNYNLNVPLEKAFLHEPRLVSDRSLVDWKPKVAISPMWFSRCWCRNLVYYIDWASHIPQLAELDDQERIHLTIGRLAPVAWHIFASRTAFHSDGKKKILLSGGTYFPLDEEEQSTMDPNMVKFLNETCQWVWSEVVEPAIQMGVTEEEFALLRVICFLTPVPLLSRKAKAVIRNAQNYYRSVLTELVVNCSTTPDFLVLSKRLSSILMLLTPLEKTAQIEDENMAVMTMFDINGMSGNLPYEFYVRRTMRF